MTAPHVLSRKVHRYDSMPEGAVCVLVEPAQKGPRFEMAQRGTGNTASVDIERSWLPRLPRFQSTSAMWYEEPLMPPAERGEPSALKPQSQREAMCPPQARTAFGPSGMKRTLTTVDDDLTFGSMLAWLT